jgi:protein SCO1/2
MMTAMPRAPGTQMTGSMPRTQTGPRTQRVQRTQRETRRAPFARSTIWIVSFVSFVTFVSFVRSAEVQGQMASGPASAGFKGEPGMVSSAVPAALREIGFDQNLDQPVPLDATFRDEAGATVRLGDYFGKRPVVLVFAYYDCPMLCTLVVNGLSSALGVLSLNPGSDFEIVTVSFNPRDTPAAAAAKKAGYLDRYNRPGAAEGWHFLTGDQPAIDRLTKAAGFRYAWDAATRQFAHPSGVIVLTADGRLARYLFGVEYGPRDLRFALVEASAGRVGSPVDTLLLYCYHYDPMTGRYGLAIMRAMRLAGAATVLAIGSFIVMMLRREKARGSTSSPRADPSGSASARRASQTARPEPFDSPLIPSLSKDEPLAQDGLVEGRGRR